MKEYKYNVTLKDAKGENVTELTTDLYAKTEEEAEMLVKQQYPPSKGFIHKLL